MRGHLIWLARGSAWKDGIVPELYPTEFRDDVVYVARNREPGVTIEQIRELNKHNRLLEQDNEVLRRAAV